MQHDSNKWECPEIVGSLEYVSLFLGWYLIFYQRLLVILKTNKTGASLLSENMYVTTEKKNHPTYFAQNLKVEVAVLFFPCVVSE